MKYLGNWSANNGSIYGNLSRNNKAELKKDLRVICKGNVFSGNTGNWNVYEITDGKRSDIPILSGKISKK